VNRGRLAGRLFIVAVVLLAAATLVTGYTGTGQSNGHVTGVGDEVAPPSNGTTVVATDSNTWLGRGSEGPRAKAELFAVAPNGTVTYYNDTHTRYWDVDPVPGTDATVEYVFADHLPARECGGESVCTRNGVERVNLTTGETTAVYSRVTPGKHATRWHDVDRLDEDHLVVADIDRDRVYVVNTSTELVTWAWSARSDYPIADSGGPYPSDWTHLNDVEVLEDGRIMASLRNHDQVVFLDRETGLNESWTLGSDGNHSRLYEQHNPDYVPAEEGGPAVVVADSENNRVVEYQREDGDWTRTWTWSDEAAQWPRDADRLPDGDTLVTDSNGNRVLRVDGEGEVVWSMDVAFPYEAERLETGDESSGGPSARQAGLGDRTADSEGGGDAGDGATDSAGLLEPLRRAITGLLDGPMANAVMYILPAWMGRIHLAALVVLVAMLPVWGLAELYWAGYRADLRRPVRFGQR
jgi:hypothetical protein